MSKVYELVEDDDIRTFRCQLDSVSVPVSAQLILVRGDVRLVRDLALNGDLWEYRFTDDDFAEGVLTTGNWKGQVYAVFADGTNGTYPTRQRIQVKIYARL